ncbi:MAG: hypothetical protein DME09_15740 [Candidatus Rokuibacteriota bacterium]|nr:MAG: hypothetical protein DME09_15740 [Candidatus Rokubacteria bacterium]
MWLDNRAVGEATITGLYADVGHARSLTYLRTAMAPHLIHHNIADAAAIRISAPRRLTQDISNHIYKLSLRDGTPRFAGIEYESASATTIRPGGSSSARARIRSTIRSFVPCAVMTQPSMGRWRPWV